MKLQCISTKEAGWLQIKSLTLNRVYTGTVTTALGSSVWCIVFDDTQNWSLFPAELFIPVEE
jgi:hypothetical protein